MRVLLGAVVSCLLCSYLSALTDEEISVFQRRIDKRSTDCGGYLRIKRSGDKVVIENNDIPDHKWGCTNPNAPDPCERVFEIPNNPEFNKDGPICMDLGVIGIAISGVSINEPITGQWRNAVEGDDAEIFDCCDAHPSPDGEYHYHKLPMGVGCDNPVFDANHQEKPQFIGVALDGFPIYGQWNGLDKDSLDICHGTTLPDGRYAYIAVENHFPYIMGCFRGTPKTNSKNQKTCGTDMSVGKMCDCQFGSLTFDDVTNTKNTKRNVESMSSPLRSTLLNYLTRSDSDDVLKCHDAKCITNEGFSLQNGKCTGTPVFPDMSNDPGRRGAPPSLGCKNREDFPNGQPGPPGGEGNNNNGGNGGQFPPRPNGGSNNPFPFPPNGDGRFPFQ